MQSGKGVGKQSQKKPPKPHTQKSARHADLTSAQRRGSSSDHSIRTHQHHRSRFMSLLCTVLTGFTDSPKIRNVPAKQQKHQLKAVLGDF